MRPRSPPSGSLFMELATRTAKVDSSMSHRRNSFLMTGGLKQTNFYCSLPAYCLKSVKQKMVKFSVQSTYSREASSVRPSWLRSVSIQNRILSASFPFLLAVLIHYHGVKKIFFTELLPWRFPQTLLLSNEKRRKTTTTTKCF